jgi:DNA repair protein RadC
LSVETIVRPECPRCGYIEPPNGDVPPDALYRPWHVRGRRAVQTYVATLGQETHEWLLALYVNDALDLLAVDTIARGDISSIDVNFWRILSLGHDLKATGFILVHNHPGGDPRPSESDIRTTRRLAHVSRELNLPLLDHLVIAGDDVMSVGYF